MNISRKIWAISIVVVIIALAGCIVALTAKNGHTAPSQKMAQPIPTGTNFAQVRQLSAGTKPPCLSRTRNLDGIVTADNKLPYEKSFSSAVGTVIPDMPAGYTDVFLHAYTPTSASGYEVFSDKNQKKFVGALNSFNFVIERSHAQATWTLKSFIACT